MTQMTFKEWTRLFKASMVFYGIDKQLGYRNKINGESWLKHLYRNYPDVADARREFTKAWKVWANVRK